MGRHGVARLHLHLLKLVHAATLGVRSRKQAHLGDLVALGPYLDGRRDDLRPGEARVEHELAERLGKGVPGDLNAAKPGRKVTGGK